MPILPNISRSMISENPMIALSGVRRPWLICAISTDLPRSGTGVASGGTGSIGAGSAPGFRSRLGLRFDIATATETPAPLACPTLHAATPAACAYPILFLFRLKHQRAGVITHPGAQAA